MVLSGITIFSNYVRFVLHKLFAEHFGASAEFPSVRIGSMLYRIISVTGTSNHIIPYTSSQRSLCRKNSVAKLFWLSVNFHDKHTFSFNFRKSKTVIAFGNASSFLISFLWTWKRQLKPNYFEVLKSLSHKSLNFIVLMSQASCN